MNFFKNLLSSAGLSNKDKDSKNKNNKHKINSDTLSPSGEKEKELSLVNYSSWTTRGGECVVKIRKLFSQWKDYESISIEDSGNVNKDMIMSELLPLFHSLATIAVDSVMIVDDGHSNNNNNSTCKVTQEIRSVSPSMTSSTNQSSPNCLYYHDVLTDPHAFANGIVMYIDSAMRVVTHNNSMNYDDDEDWMADVDGSIIAQEDNAVIEQLLVLPVKGDDRVESDSRVDSVEDIFPTSSYRSRVQTVPATHMSNDDIADVPVETKSRATNMYESPALSQATPYYLCHAFNVLLMLIAGPVPSASYQPTPSQHSSIIQSIIALLAKNSIINHILIIFYYLCYHPQCGNGNSDVDHTSSKLSVYNSLEIVLTDLTCRIFSSSEAFNYLVDSSSRSIADNNSHTNDITTSNKDNAIYLLFYLLGDHNYNKFYNLKKQFKNKQKSSDVRVQESLKALTFRSSSSSSFSLSKMSLSTTHTYHITIRHHLLDIINHLPLHQLSQGFSRYVQKYHIFKMILTSMSPSFLLLYPDYCCIIYIKLLNFIKVMSDEVFGDHSSDDNKVIITDVLLNDGGYELLEEVLMLFIQWSDPSHPIHIADESIEQTTQLCSHLPVNVHPPSTYHHYFEIMISQIIKLVYIGNTSSIQNIKKNITLGDAGMSAGWNVLDDYELSTSSRSPPQHLEKGNPHTTSSTVMTPSSTSANRSHSHGQEIGDTISHGYSSTMAMDDHHPLSSTSSPILNTSAFLILQNVVLRLTQIVGSAKSSLNSNSISFTSSAVNTSMHAYFQAYLIGKIKNIIITHPLNYYIVCYENNTLILLLENFNIYNEEIQMLILNIIEILVVDVGKFPFLELCYIVKLINYNTLSTESVINIFNLIKKIILVNRKFIYILKEVGLIDILVNQFNSFSKSLLKEWLVEDVDEELTMNDDNSNTTEGDSAQMPGVQDEMSDKETISLLNDPSPAKENSSNRRDSSKSANVQTRALSPVRDARHPMNIDDNKSETESKDDPADPSRKRISFGSADPSLLTSISTLSVTKSSCVLMLEVLFLLLEDSVDNLNLFRSAARNLDHTTGSPSPSIAIYNLLNPLIYYNPTRSTALSILICNITYSDDIVNDINNIINILNVPPLPFNYSLKINILDDMCFLFGKYYELKNTFRELNGYYILMSLIQQLIPLGDVNGIENNRNIDKYYVSTNPNPQFYTTHNSSTIHYESLRIQLLSSLLSTLLHSLVGNDINRHYFDTEIGLESFRSAITTTGVIGCFDDDGMDGGTSPDDNKFNRSENNALYHETVNLPSKDKQAGCELILSILFNFLVEVDDACHSNLKLVTTHFEIKNSNIIILLLSILSLLSHSTQARVLSLIIQLCENNLVNLNHINRTIPLFEYVIQNFYNVLIDNNHYLYENIYILVSLVGRSHLNSSDLSVLLGYLLPPLPRPGSNNRNNGSLNDAENSRARSPTVVKKNTIFVGNPLLSNTYSDCHAIIELTQSLFSSPLQGSMLLIDSRFHKSPKLLLNHHSFVSGNESNSTFNDTSPTNSKSVSMSSNTSSDFLLEIAESSSYGICFWVWFDVLSPSASSKSSIIPLFHITNDISCVSLATNPGSIHGHNDNNNSSAESVGASSTTDDLDGLILDVSLSNNKLIIITNNKHVYMTDNLNLRTKKWYHISLSFYRHFIGSSSVTVIVNNNYIEHIKINLVNNINKYRSIVVFGCHHKVGPSTNTDISYRITSIRIFSMGINRLSSLSLFLLGPYYRGRLNLKLINNTRHLPLMNNDFLLLINNSKLFDCLNTNSINSICVDNDHILSLLLSSTLSSSASLLSSPSSSSLLSSLLSLSEQLIYCYDPLTNLNLCHSTNLSGNSTSSSILRGNAPKLLGASCLQCTPASIIIQQFGGLGVFISLLFFHSHYYYYNSYYYHFYNNCSEKSDLAKPPPPPPDHTFTSIVKLISSLLNSSANVLAEMENMNGYEMIGYIIRFNYFYFVNYYYYFDNIVDNSSDVEKLPRRPPPYSCYPNSLIDSIFSIVLQDDDLIVNTLALEYIILNFDNWIPHYYCVSAYYNYVPSDNYRPNVAASNESLTSHYGELFYNILRRIYHLLIHPKFGKINRVVFFRLGLGQRSLNILMKLPYPLPCLPLMLNIIYVVLYYCSHEDYLTVTSCVGTGPSQDNNITNEGATHNSSNVNNNSPSKYLSSISSIILFTLPLPSIDVILSLPKKKKKKKKGTSFFSSKNDLSPLHTNVPTGTMSSSIDSVVNSDKATPVDSNIRGNNPIAGKMFGSNNKDENGNGFPTKPILKSTSASTDDTNSNNNSHEQKHFQIIRQHLLFMIARYVTHITHSSTPVTASSSSLNTFNSTDRSLNDASYSFSSTHSSSSASTGMSDVVPEWFVADNEAYYLNPSLSLFAFPPLNDSVTPLNRDQELQLFSHVFTPDYLLIIIENCGMDDISVIAALYILVLLSQHLPAYYYNFCVNEHHRSFVYSLPNYCHRFEISFLLYCFLNQVMLPPIQSLPHSHLDPKGNICAGKGDFILNNINNNNINLLLLPLSLLRNHCWKLGGDISMFYKSTSCVDGTNNSSACTNDDRSQFNPKFADLSAMYLWSLNQLNFIITNNKMKQIITKHYFMEFVSMYTEILLLSLLLQENKSYIIAICNNNVNETEEFYKEDSETSPCCQALPTSRKVFSGIHCSLMFDWIVTVIVDAIIIPISTPVSSYNEIEKQLVSIISTVLHSFPKEAPLSLSHCFISHVFVLVMIRLSAAVDSHTFLNSASTSIVGASIAGSLQLHNNYGKTLRLRLLSKFCSVMMDHIHIHSHDQLIIAYFFLKRLSLILYDDIVSSHTCMSLRSPAHNITTSASPPSTFFSSSPSKRLPSLWSNQSPSPSSLLWPPTSISSSSTDVTHPHYHALIQFVGYLQSVILLLFNFVEDQCHKRGSIDYDGNDKPDDYLSLLFNLSSYNVLSSSSNALGSPTVAHNPPSAFASSKLNYYRMWILNIIREDLTLVFYNTHICSEHHSNLGSENTTMPVGTSAVSSINSDNNGSSSDIILFIRTLCYQLHQLLVDNNRHAEEVARAVFSFLLPTDNNMSYTLLLQVLQMTEENGHLRILNDEHQLTDGSSTQQFQDNESLLRSLETYLHTPSNISYNTELSDGANDPPLSMIDYLLSLVSNNHPYLASLFATAFYQHESLCMSQKYDKPVTLERPATLETFSPVIQHSLYMNRLKNLVDNCFVVMNKNIWMMRHDIQHNIYVSAVLKKLLLEFSSPVSIWSSQASVIHYLYNIEDDRWMLNLADDGSRQRKIFIKNINRFGDSIPVFYHPPNHSTSCYSMSKVEEEAKSVGGIPFIRKHTDHSPSATSIHHPLSTTSVNVAIPGAPVISSTNAHKINNIISDILDDLYSQPYISSMITSLTTVHYKLINLLYLTSTSHSSTIFNASTAPTVSASNNDFDVDDSYPNSATLSSSLHSHKSRQRRTLSTSGHEPLPLYGGLPAIAHDLRSLKILTSIDKIIAVFNGFRILGLDKIHVIVVISSFYLYIIDCVGLSPEAEGCHTNANKPPSPTDNTENRYLYPSFSYHHHQHRHRSASSSTMTDYLASDMDSSSEYIWLLLARNYQKISYDMIVEIQKRRYCLQHNSIELFCANGVSELLIFLNNKIRDDVYNKLLLMEINHQNISVINNKELIIPLNHSTTNSPFASLSSFISDSTSTGKRLKKQIRKSLTAAWSAGVLSNFNYLMELNILSGRSYRDLTQYPIFPWILSNYDNFYFKRQRETSESSTNVSLPALNLHDPSNFRDLSKPMGILSDVRKSKFITRYNDWEDDHIPKFHYGTHYSSAAIVMQYMIRVDPFSQHALHLQDGRFDLPDRLFHSISDTWGACSGLSTDHSTSMSDVKELIPEFFFLPEMFINHNKNCLGVKQCGGIINDVVLPSWCGGDPYKFITMNRRALECPHVSAHLPEWIDLIFGFKQKGAAAVDAVNVFYYLTYEGEVNLDAITSDHERASMLSQIKNFGQTPQKLFNKPHALKNYVNYKLINIYSHCEWLCPYEICKLNNKVSQIKVLNSSPSGNAGGSGAPKNALYYPSLLLTPDYKDDKLLIQIGKRVLVPPLYNLYLRYDYQDYTVKEIGMDGSKVYSIFDNLHNNHAITVIIVSDNGRLVFTGGNDGTIGVWNYITFVSTKHSHQYPKYHHHDLQNRRPLKLLKRLVGHTESIITLYYSMALGILASGGGDGRIILWNINNSTNNSINNSNNVTNNYYIRSLPSSSLPITALTMNDRLGYIIVCSGITVSVYTLNGLLICNYNHTNTYSNDPQLAYITSVTLSSGHEWFESHIIVTGHSNGDVCCFSLIDGLTNISIYDRNVTRNSNIPSSENVVELAPLQVSLLSDPATPAKNHIIYKEDDTVPSAPAVTLSTISSGINSVKTAVNDSSSRPPSCIHSSTPRTAQMTVKDSLSSTSLTSSIVQSSISSTGAHVALPAASSALLTPRITQMHQVRAEQMIMMGVNVLEHDCSSGNSINTSSISQSLPKGDSIPTEDINSLNSVLQTLAEDIVYNSTDDPCIVLRNDDNCESTADEDHDNFSLPTECQPVSTTVAIVPRLQLSSLNNMQTNIEESENHENIKMSSYNISYDEDSSLDDYTMNSSMNIEDNVGVNEDSTVSDDGNDNDIDRTSNNSTDYEDDEYDQEKIVNIHDGTVVINTLDVARAVINIDQINNDNGNIENDTSVNRKSVVVEPYVESSLYQLSHQLRLRRILCHHSCAISTLSIPLHHKCIYSGDISGRVVMWRIPSVDRNPSTTQTSNATDGIQQQRWKLVPSDGSLPPLTPLSSSLIAQPRPMSSDPIVNETASGSVTSTDLSVAPIDSSARASIDKPSNLLSFIF